MSAPRGLVASFLVLAALLAGCADDGERVSTPTGPTAAVTDTESTAPSTTAASPDTVPADTTVPDDTVPDDTVPDDTVPDGTVPDDSVPDDTVPTDPPPTTTSSGSRTNELGEPVTLDQAGDLACANAEFAQDSVLEGDSQQAQLDVEAAADRAAESTVPAMATAGPAIAGALDTSDPLGAVQEFLAVCTDHGYEL